MSSQTKTFDEEDKRYALPTLYANNFLQWRKESNPTMLSYGDAGQEAYHEKPLKNEEPMETEYVTRLVKKDGRVESIRELWSSRQEQNDNKLIREQDAYRAKMAQFKRDKGRLFTALYKCMSKEVKDLVRLQETRYKLK